MRCMSRPGLAALLCFHRAALAFGASLPAGHRLVRSEGAGALAPAPLDVPAEPDDDGMLEEDAVEAAGQKSDTSVAGRPLVRSLTEQPHENYTWLPLGFAIGLLGSSMIVTGLMLEKQSLDEQKKELQEAGASCMDTSCLNRKWICGFLLFGGGNIVTWVSLGMAPNTILTMFSSWNIIFTMVVGPWFLGEYVSFRAKMFGLLLVIGCAWVALAGPQSYRQKSLHGLNKDFGYPAWQVCTGVLVAYFLMALASWVRTWRYEAEWSSFIVGIVASMSSIGASYAMLCSKCTSQVAEKAIRTGDLALLRPEVFILAFGAFCGGLTQITFLNESLKHGDTVFVIPLYESMALSIELIVGGMMFQEYADFTWERHLLFWPGVATVMIGIFLLTHYADKDKAEYNKHRELEESDAGAQSAEAGENDAAAFPAEK